MTYMLFCHPVLGDQHRAGWAGQDDALEKDWMGLRCCSEAPEVHIRTGTYANYSPIGELGSAPKSSFQQQV